MSTPAAPPTAASVRADLIAEQDALDAVISDLDDELWALETPSPRWTIADQIGHLTYFDWTAAMAITDPSRFTTLTTELMASMAGGDADAMDLATLGDYRAMTPQELCHAWRTNRGVLSEASASLADDDRVIWYGRRRRRGAQRSRASPRRHPPVRRRAPRRRRRGSNVRDRQRR